MSTEGVKFDMELPLKCSGQNLEGFAVILYSATSRSRHMSPAVTDTISSARALKVRSNSLATCLLSRSFHKEIKELLVAANRLHKHTSSIKIGRR